MKRKPGIRAKALLDDIDMKILIALSKKHHSVLELVNKLEVAHHSLIKHIDYLTKEGIIIKDNSQKGRIIILRLKDKYKPVVKIFEKGFGIKKLFNLLAWLDNLIKSKNPIQFIKTLNKKS